MSYGCTRGGALRAVAFSRVGIALARRRHGDEIHAAMESELRRVLELPVDVVSLNDASPLLRFEAVIRGVALLVLDQDEAFRFEMRTRRQFEDFRHIQRIFTADFRRRLGMSG